jgi:hypothetical protein
MSLYSVWIYADKLSLGITVKQVVEFCYVFNCIAGCVKSHAVAFEGTEN